MTIQVLCTVGRTGVGKTTLARFLASEIGLRHISEGAIKRGLIEVSRPYRAEDSLDEHLRDRGYQLAIDSAMNAVEDGDSVIVDASFHKFFRRQWLYEAVRKRIASLAMIWLECSNERVLRNRIEARKAGKKTADNQADQVKILEHISIEFDKVRFGELNGIAGCLFQIDTFDNRLISYGESPDLLKLSGGSAYLRDAIDRWVVRMRENSQ